MVFVDAATVGVRSIFDIPPITVADAIHQLVFSFDKVEKANEARSLFD